VRTILDIDRDLLQHAKEVLRQPSFTATVTEALREAVDRRREEQREGLRQFLEHLAGLDDESVRALRDVRKSNW